MANPAGYMNTYSQQPAVDGVGYSGPIPNGQPPQFPRPPMFPQKVAPPRPLMVGQQPSFPPNQVASNGQNSHTSSLSSHSSRNPSPIPPRPNDDSLSSSTPNLAHMPPASLAPNNPPMYSTHQQSPMNAGIPKVSSSPYLGHVSSAGGPQRHNYMQQQSTQSLANVSQTSTMAASHQNVGPLRHQLPPSNPPSQMVPNLQSGPVQPQVFPSLNNSLQGAPSSQAGLVRPQLPPPNMSTTTNSQFGMDRQQFPPNLSQMPFNSPQPSPSYQAGFIRPQMPSNMPQAPSNPQLGPPRQVVPNSQPGVNPPPMSQVSFTNARAPSQLPPTSNFAVPNQVYNNPNIPPKSVLNARYPETSIAPSGMNSQPAVISNTVPQQSLATPLPGPRPTMAQNRYPQNPIATRPQFSAEPHPMGPQNTYPSAALTSGPPGPPGPGLGSGPPHSQNNQSVHQTLTSKPQPLVDFPLKATSAESQVFPPSSAASLQTGPPVTVPSSTGYSQSGVTPVYGPPLPPTQTRTDVSGSHLGKRYPTQPQPPYTNQIQPSMDTTGLNHQMGSMSITQQGFQKLWGTTSYDLLQQRNILPPEKVETPKVKLHQEFLDSVNCSPEIFRCTMTKIPETGALLQKSRLPLGILIHPFKDLNHLAVIQCSSIVRCRACRTYINPFVYFVDHKRWKCNLCFRVNELPEEFQFDPVSKTYGDPTRRPEIKSATIEFIAPSEYMLRPPQPAVYLFVLDVSRLGVECGYLQLFCQTLIEELDKLPGDGRTQIGFITFDSSVHFYNLAEGLNQPQQMIVVDVDDIFLPVPDSLIVNLNESKELIRDLLNQLPQKFQDSSDTHSALGPALQAAYKLMAPTGGRVTVFQSCLPNFGPGALVCREDPTLRAGKEAPHLNPATDFYKRLALDCSGQQIAVDLFIVNSQYCDLATLSGISRFSGGCIHHIPLFKASNPHHAEKLQQMLKRYLSRKLGMEAVMRIRCSRGLSIHTFHGNFFVRSTDLLSLPNVNPDAGFGMQVAVEENLSDLQNVCFQAALLYTSTKGERRIRVHTMCLPVSANLSDIIHAADQQCIIGLLAKMGVDRSHQSSLADARDAFINVAIDMLSAYRIAQSCTGSNSLLVPHNLRLLPLYILALLKYIAFRTGQSTRLDDRLFAMCQLKALPLTNLIQEIYPDLYPIHNLSDENEIDVEGTIVSLPPRLQLTSEKLEISGAYILDAGDNMIVFIGRNVNSTFCQSVFGVQSFSQISEDILELPEIDTPESDRLRRFVNYLQSEKPFPATIQVIRDDSQTRVKFYERLIEDRTESALSYYEFLQHLKTNVK